MKMIEYQLKCFYGRYIYITVHFIFLLCYSTYLRPHGTNKKNKILLYDLKPKEYQILFNLI